MGSSPTAGIYANAVNNGNKLIFLDFRLLMCVNNVVMKHENSTRRSTNIIVCRDAKSPYWMAQFTSPEGRRIRRSTKIPVAGGFYNGERLTKAQAKNRALIVAADFAKAAEADSEQQSRMTVRELFNVMLDGQLGRVSLATYKNARTDYRQFLDWLGKRADDPITRIRRADAMAWLVDRRAQVRHATCRKAMSALKAAFAWAKEADIISENPFTGLRVQPDTKDEKIVHEAFTADEIRILLDKLPDEWSAAVMCCIGTFGQRLGDVLSLRWSQFDWDARVVRIVTGKTRRVLIQPMMPDFYDWAFARFQAAVAAGGDAAVWVLPRLRLHSNPSPEFTQLVRLHGIGLNGESTGGSRRVWHSKTFHSLRASVATMLQAAGVSQGMAMELVGHESEAVHSVYIRPSVDQLMYAASKLAILKASE